MAGAESHVRVPADSTGKKMRTVKETIGANEVHNEGVVVVDPTDTTQVMGVSAAGDAQVEVAVALPAGANAIGKLAANSGVDIGDTDVTSVVPGVAATNLGKAEDAVHASGDTGVAQLLVRKDTAVSLVNADGDYTIPIVDEVGRTYVRPESTYMIEELDDHTSWAALGNDTLNLATNTQYHVSSTASVQFDKVNGADDTVFGVIDQTIAALDLSSFDIHETLQVATYVSSVVDIDYMLIRLGTDNANYNEWRVDGDELTAGQWNIVKFTLGSASVSGATGTGMNPDVVTYVAIGYAFDNQTNALANIRFNHFAMHSSIHTNADIASEVTSEVSSPNVNVKKWGAVNVTTDQGNSDTGTLRVAVADDDTNLAAISAAVQAEDDAHTTADKGVMLLGVRNDTPATFTNVDLDYIPISCDEYGRVLTRSVHEKTDYPHAFFNAAADGALVAAVGGKVIKVHAMYLQAAGTVVVNIRTNNAAGTILASWTLQAREGVAGYDFVPYPAHHFQTAAGEALYVDVTAAVNVTVNCIYTDDDAA